MWWARQAAGAMAFLCGSLLAFGSPRLTLINAGLRVDYPASRWTGALLAAAGAALLAAGFNRRLARAGCATLAVAAVALAADRISYRLEADAAALVCRAWGERTTLPWREISRVEAGPAKIVVWAGAETRVAVDTSRFRPEQRAALDRTIARRVMESGSVSRR